LRKWKREALSQRAQRKRTEVTEKSDPRAEPEVLDRSFGQLLNLFDSVPFGPH
jgi:hypothetical protein